jgi:hypothetical protein
MQPTPKRQRAPWTQKPAAASLSGGTAAAASSTDTAAASPAVSMQPTPKPQPAPWTQKPAVASLPGGMAADPRGGTPTGTVVGSGKGVAPTAAGHADPSASSSSTSTAPTCDGKKPRVHFASDPTGDKNQKFLAEIRPGDAVLISASDFKTLLLGTHSKGLGPDDGIVGKANSISRTPCGGRTFFLHSVSWLSLAASTGTCLGSSSRKIV